MDWVYVQQTGELYKRDNGVCTLYAAGYAGNGDAKNDPDRQDEKDHGPLPRGSYSIGRPVDQPGNPFMLPLTPSPGNDMCGRDEFYIHGDKISAPGTASNGCIILSPREKREDIWAEVAATPGRSQLIVVADLDSLRAAEIA